MPQSKNLLLAFSCLLFLSLPSCSTSPCQPDKERFLHAYYELLDEAKQADLPVSDPAWGKYDERFRAYVEECYEVHEPAMSRRERRKFWSRSLSYYYQRYGDGVAKELKGSSRTSKRMKEAVEALWDSPEAAFDDALRGARKDWRELKSKMKEVFE